MSTTKQIGKNLGQVKRSNLESLEKYFFIFILENPKFFGRIAPMFFKNVKIKYVYEIIHHYFTSMDSPKTPSDHKIYELVRMSDPDSEKVTDTFIKDLLKVDLNNIVQDKNDDFLKKSLYSWSTTNSMKNQFHEVIDWIRDMDEIDYDNTVEMSEKIREAISASTLMDYDTDDLGLDFFDPEAHIQDSAKNKIATGWDSLDELLDGGLDRKTLNIVMGASNSGKSLWLCNFAANAAKGGKNVLYVTLEMSDRLIMKRIGSMWLRVNINEYDQFSKDQDRVKNRLREVSQNFSTFGSADNMFESTRGQLFVREFPSGTAAVSDIESLVKKYDEEKGIKIDMVVVDYLTIMQPEKSKDGSLFSNGKFLSNGLRAIAQKYDLCMVTAMQIGKDSYDSPDISLSDISESKAIVENADSIWGIIRTPAMKLENKYILKLLKLRNGAFKWIKTHFSLNPHYLSIENDTKMGETA